MEFDISFVMTVYNKERYLPSVLKALLGQTGVKNPQYVFVDDGSSDKSVEIIREAMKDVPNVILQINDKNMGISPTTNRAIKLAQGKWTRMLDSDDILPLDSTEQMMKIADENNADIVYGKFRKTGKKAEELTEVLIGENWSYKYSSDTLMTILNGRFTRMGWLIKTAVLQKSDGADERAFIQDESIPVRAGMIGNGVIKMDANVVLVPEEIGNFSGNKTQLNADRFLVYYWTIKDNPDLPEAAQRRMYQKAVSAYWKEVRATEDAGKVTGAFVHYILSKIIAPKPNMKFLEKMKKYFDKKSSFRRTAGYR